MSGTHLDGPGVEIVHRDDYAEPRTLTHTGRWVDPTNPAPADIVIEDIAYALSHQARYNGMHGPYTVAQHSIMAAWMVSDEYRVATLLHDAPEAYIGDLSHPIKHGHPILGPAFRAVEAVVEDAVEKAFGLDPGALSHPAVKSADRAVFRMEWETIVEETADHFEVWTADECVRKFLSTFEVRP
jgi:hypothetical protein